MKNKENNRVATAATALLMLLTPALSAMADCSQLMGVLTIDPGDESANHTQSISFRQTNGKRCIPLTDPDPTSKEFSIEVKNRTGAGDPDLSSISVRKKTEADPVEFNVISTYSVGPKHFVEIEFETTADTGEEEEFHYDIIVADIGVLDPAVQIIRTTSRMYYISALEELAEQYLDPADREEIVELIRSLK